jgi:hypothetical protein
MLFLPTCGQANMALPQSCSSVWTESYLDKCRYIPCLSEVTIS